MRLAGAELGARASRSKAKLATATERADLIFMECSNLLYVDNGISALDSKKCGARITYRADWSSFSCANDTDTLY